MKGLPHNFSEMEQECGRAAKRLGKMPYRVAARDAWMEQLHGTLLAQRLIGYMDGVRQERQAQRDGERCNDGSHI